MDENSIVQNIEQTVSSAEQAMSKSLSILQDIEKEYPSAAFSEHAVIEGAQSLQYILQYRLDTQDALACLRKIDQSVLQILGIELQSSPGENMERMAFAMGQEDLHQVLHSLNQLADALLHAAYQYKNKKRSYSDSHKKSSKHQSSSQFNKSLYQAIKYQKQFATALMNLHCTLQALVKMEAIGPVLNHISAINGPISRFYQAIHNGLTLSHGLYQKINKEVALEKTIDGTVQKINKMMKQLISPNQQQLFHPVKLEETNEQLENRASKKRLGHFFRH